jgi:hypothetical protein
MRIGVCLGLEKAVETRLQSRDQERAQERWNEVVELLSACHEDRVFVCELFKDYIKTSGVCGGTGLGNTQHIVAVGTTMAPAAATKHSPAQGLSRLDTKEQRRWHPGNDNPWRIYARHCTSAVPAGLAGANSIEKVVWVVLDHIKAQGFATYVQVRDAFFNASPDIRALLWHNPEATQTLNNCFSRYWTSAVTHEGRSPSRTDRQNLRIPCVCQQQVKHASISGFPKKLVPAFIGLLNGPFPSQYFQAHRHGRKGNGLKTPNSKVRVDSDAGDGSDGPQQYPAMDVGQVQQNGQLRLKAAPAAAGAGSDTKDANIATADTDSSSPVHSDAGYGSYDHSQASSAMDEDDAGGGLPVATNKRNINADDGWSAACVVVPSAALALNNIDVAAEQLANPAMGRDRRPRWTYARKAGGHSTKMNLR